MSRALLVIGDKKFTSRKISLSFQKFVRYAQKLSDKGAVELKVINYTQLLSGRAPAIEAAEILAVFFFPYQYWNRYIEIYPDDRIYGDEKFGREFKIFFNKVEQAISKYYRDKKIKYLNAPQAAYLDRDKLATKNLLRKSKIPTPRTFEVSSFTDIQRLLNRGINLYIKPRFGALGKGITYIDREGVISNFIFRKGKIISRPYYNYRWKFIRIRDERLFVSKLLKKDFICEEAIEPATFRGRRFDFRVYVIFGRAVYLYAKSAKSAYVTNWSQGGKIDRRKVILKTFPRPKLTQLVRLARKASRTLGLNFTGIDIIFSKDLKQAYVMEGNGFPGYEKGFDLMKCLLKFILR